MSKLQQLNDLGQAIWLDYIRRAFTRGGDLQRLIDEGLRGVTSNPSIFEKAIAGSGDYDDDLARYAEAGMSDTQIYEALVIEDIREAADLLRSLYDQSGGDDGYVSLEVSPELARDTDGTIAEASRLFAAIERPNVMIKIPATPEGIPAIRATIGAGINVNVTLIFSLQQYEATAAAYLAGLEDLRAAGGDVAAVASVASFFVSRVDTAVDEALEQAGNRELQGKIAIDNARVAYARCGELFAGDRWQALAAAGARIQRPLWASTGTKNPQYSDTLYIDSLIGPDTVNTVPPATLDRFRDHGTAARTVDQDVDGARRRLEQLSAAGVDLGAITEQLQRDGVDSFAKSFRALMDGIAGKREELSAAGSSRRPRLELALGTHAKAVDSAFTAARDQRLMQRIWQRDHTVWKPDPAEISNRLGWLDIAESMYDHLGRIRTFAAAVRDAGLTRALLLGMGGSSLAPEVFARTFGTLDVGLELAVLDSTDPAAVAARAEQFDPAETLFIVSTKSGGTVETMSLFKFFYNRVAAAVGEEAAGGHFIAITDPGSGLVDVAERYRFRDTFLNDPEIGGRYSALSFFGLVPAALLGLDLEDLLERALLMARNADACNCPRDGDNYAARLGLVMGTLAQRGRDKLTLVVPEAIVSFGDWVEQLIAESTGKEGRGIVPVVGEPLGGPGAYGEDRLFVQLRTDDERQDAAVAALRDAGQPVVVVRVDDAYDLGGQFFLWEMATAVAGAVLAINPFDQPNVESAKVRAQEMVGSFEREGALPELTPTCSADGITAYTAGAGDADATAAASPMAALAELFDGADAKGYIGVQAYLPPTAALEQALRGLQAAIRARTGRAVTLGYGPRFLHSTGQLHKGDAGLGRFLQLTADADHDLPIPDQAGADASAMSFGTLEAAQALGDRQALLDEGRAVLRLHITADPVAVITRLAAAL